MCKSHLGKVNVLSLQVGWQTYYDVEFHPLLRDAYNILIFMDKENFISSVFSALNLGGQSSINENNFLFL